MTLLGRVAKIGKSNIGRAWIVCSFSRKYSKCFLESFLWPKSQRMEGLFSLAKWQSLVAPSNWNSGFCSNSGRIPNFGLEQGHSIVSGYCLSSIQFSLRNHPEDPKIRWANRSTYSPTKNNSCSQFWERIAYAVVLRSRQWQWQQQQQHHGQQQWQQEQQQPQQPQQP